MATFWKNYYKIGFKTVVSLYRGLTFRQQRNLMTILRFVVHLPLIDYLYHRIYQRLISKKSKIFPRNITIETCNICNLNCIMCPYSVMTREKGTMSMELFSRIVDDAVAMGIGELSLTNYGEPLLDEFLVQRIEYAKRKGMRVGFTSNGTLLRKGDNSVKLLQSGVDWIDISIDGITKQTYEKIRNGAKFEDMIDGFKKLIRERKYHSGNTKIGINCCVQVSNYDEVGNNKREFHRLFKDADYRFFGPEYIRGDNDGSSSSRIGYRVSGKYSRYQYPCRLAFEDILVLVDGSIVLCCMDYDGKIILGNLSIDSIKDIWNSPQFTKIRKLHLAGQGRQVQICSSCARMDGGKFEWW